MRLDGGMTTRSIEYQQTFRRRQFWGIMTVTADPFEDEADEFGRVCAIFREKGGFRRNNKDPPFYVPVSKEMLPADHMGLIVSIVKIIICS